MLLALVVMTMLGAGHASAAVRETKPPTSVLATGTYFKSAAMLEDGTALITYYGNVGTNSDTGLYLCRLPRRAERCASKVLLDGDRPGHPAHILVPDPTDEPQVVEVVYGTHGRLAANAGTTLVRRSEDGGRSFAPAVAVADGLYDATTAVDGPGGFRFSAMDGATYQAAPYDPSDGAPAGTARLWASDGYNTYLAAVDATTPLAVRSDTTSGRGLHIEYRRFSGSGDVNLARSWTSARAFRPDHGISEVVGLASAGPRGAFLGYVQQTASGCGPRFLVSRFTASGFEPGVAVDPSDHAKDPDCSYGDTGSPGGPIALGADAGGDLYAVFTFSSSGTDRARPDGMYYATSGDGGVSWSSPKLLYRYLTRDRAHRYIVSVAASALVANTKGDALLVAGDGVGTLRVFRLKGLNSETGPGVCKTSLRFGVVRALSTEGCFRKVGDHYETSAPLKVNGIDFTPPGAVAHARGGTASAPRFELNPAAGTLTTTGEWRAHAGAVDLGEQVLHWKVPGGGGPVLDSVTGDLAHLDASQGAQRILGLPVSGLVLPRFVAGGKAVLPVNLKVPDPIGGFEGGPLTDNVDLPVDNAHGIVLKKGSIAIKLPTVSLGIAEISPFEIDYTNDPNRFTGAIGVMLPVVGRIDANIVFEEGEFRSATAKYTPPPPGLEIAGPIFLVSIDAHVNKGRSCNDPTSFGIGARLAGGPSAGGSALVTIDGDATYELPEGSCGRPGVFTISGDGAIADLNVAQVYLRYVTTGIITFGAEVHLGDPSVVEVRGGIRGGIAFDSGDAYAEGKLDVHAFDRSVASADAVFGTAGIGACARLTLLPGIAEIPGVPGKVDAGIKYRFGDGLHVYYDDCDVSDLIPAKFAGQASTRGHVAATGTRTITVAPGTRVQTFDAKARIRAPQFELFGPRGEHYVTPTSQQFLRREGGVTRFAADSIQEAGITVRAPSAGAWRLVPLPGSEPPTEVQGAAAGVHPTVTAHVRKDKGRRFRVSYRATMPRGAQLRFFEAGAGTTRSIGRGRAGSHAFTFTAADGTLGRRHIVARVQSEAGPLAVLTIARFRSPGPIIPSRPKHVGLLRGTRHGLRIAWSPSAGATRYLVRVVLKDGRKAEFLRPRRRRTVLLAAVPRFDTGRVEIYGISRDRRLGRPHTVDPAPAEAPAKPTPQDEAAQVAAGPARPHLSARPPPAASGSPARVLTMPYDRGPSPPRVLTADVARRCGRDIAGRGATEGRESKPPLARSSVRARRVGALISTDYLVVGAGAAGLAFADVLVAEADVEVTLVDRRGGPGGHWLDAYPFVRLHTPSAYYGVNSLALGEDRVDETGENAGFYERATGHEVCAHFAQAAERLVATGRVTLLLGHEHAGTGHDGERIRELSSGVVRDIAVRRKVVDARYLEASIPATHTPVLRDRR